MTAIVPNITRREAVAIREALVALAAIAKRASYESHNNANAAQADLARLSTAASIAGDIVFDVVSVANAHLRDPNARRIVRVLAEQQREATP